MNHPFKVGESYSNRYGRYQVLSIDDPKMRVRYEDGREINLTIAIQTQILEGIQLAEQQPKPVAKVKKGRKKKRSPSTRLGYKFSGLEDSDFKSNVTGTHWRRRESLGGRLAQQLSDTTPYLFQSHAIYRRPSVYITMPDHYDPKDGIPYAKNELRLFPEGAQYGFYIERADQKSREVDDTWHWRPFLRALETDGQLQANLLQAMQDQDLFWLLSLEEGEGRNYSVTKEIKVRAGRPLLWDETEDINWFELVNLLQAMPSEQWLNLHLCSWINKSEAIAAGERFADSVCVVFRSVLPLYAACAALS